MEKLMFPFRIRAFALLFVANLLAAVTTALAQEPNVTAVLTDAETTIGRPVQLQIQVSGASSPKPPAQITVDGLDIRAAGTSRQYQMQNFSVSYSFTFSYTIFPERAGSFKIPSQAVEAGGKTLQTPELTLTVANSPGGQSARPGRGSGGGNTANDNVDPAQIGFVEMLLPKSVAYVGEMIPVQIRLGLNMRAPVDSLGSGVQIAGQGFTTQKIGEPRQTVENINGRSYQVFIFKTAIAAVRSGTLEIGPAEINPSVRVPMGGQRNPSLPRDLFDDPFFNNFFNDPARGRTVTKEVKLKSKPTTLEVKALPPNPPGDFSGAVGTFSLKADANPKTVQVGDPITVKASIFGRGNFDRVNAPALEDESGWHKYPSADKFERDDDVGISGTKAFETVVSPKERKDKLPPLVFSFFDPIKENYVTLRSDAIPLKAEGGAPATPAPTVAAAAATTVPPTTAPSSTPAPAPQTPVQDILAQLDDRPAKPQSFQPPYTQRSFWLAQLLPLLGLLGFVGWKLRRARLDDLQAQRVQRLQHEAAEVERRMRANGVSPQQYVADASRAVQLKTALARNIDPNTVNAEIAAAAFRLDEAEHARLRQLFEQSDELRYSGQKNGNGTISPQRQQEIQDLVESLRA